MPSEILNLKSSNTNETFVRNHIRLGDCVADTGYGLGKSLGDCSPALPKGLKYQMVKTHKLRATLGSQ